MRIRLTNAACATASITIEIAAKFATTVKQVYLIKLLLDHINAIISVALDSAETIVSFTLVYSSYYVGSLRFFFIL